MAQNDIRDNKEPEYKWQPVHAEQVNLCVTHPYQNCQGSTPKQGTHGKAIMSKDYRQRRTVVLGTAYESRTRKRGQHQRACTISTPANNSR